MMRALLFAVLLAGCGAAMAAEPDSVLTADGIGNIKVGTPVNLLERIVRQKLPYNPYANHGCAVLTTRELEPRGVSFMIEQKLLTRVNVDFYGSDPRPLAIKTEAGIRLGSAEDDIIMAYGDRVRVEANPLDPAWHTLYVDAPDRSKAMVFETDGKKVKSIRVGEYPSVASRGSCEQMD